MDEWLAKVNQLVKSGLGTPIMVLVLLAMVTVPLPAFMLDVFFTFNIALSLVILMVSLSIKRTLDFAMLPSVILITTLMRLALNIASTRVILLEGHNGPEAAGQVINAFGEFVIGGNYAVGIVIFAILVVINFVVVTKGAGRVAEVAARFQLDSMPGKQMAIDADLNAGLIDQAEAQRRRKELAMESEFNGSMDGASKFVRGDAIAGIIILFINIIGGFIIGMAQHGLSFGEAVEIYTLLSIGDGLVAQIPALLLSVATGLIVTRVGDSDESVGAKVSEQLFRTPLALGVTSGIMAVMGAVPGMPNVAFLSMSALAGGGAYLIARKHKEVERLAQQKTQQEVIEEKKPPKPADLDWKDISHVDILGLEVGYRLISMVDPAQNGTLIDRIRGIRRKVSQELGFLVQPVHIRDNLDLEPNRYQISVMGVIVGEGDVHPERELAINPGQVFGKVKGINTKDPTFGLEAVWITKGDHDQAQALGYTVVDASTVIATHISQIVQDFAHQLFGFEEGQQVIEKIKESSPKLVEEVIPSKVTLSNLVVVLQNLLKDRVPIRDMRSILEALGEYNGSAKDPLTLTNVVRRAIGGFIVQQILPKAAQLKVMTLEPQLEQILIQATQGVPQEQLALEPSLAEQMHRSIAEQSQRIEMEGQFPVLVTNELIRPALARFFRFSLPSLRVLAYNEIPEDRNLSIVAVIGQTNN